MVERDPSKVDVASSNLVSRFPAVPSSDWPRATHLLEVAQFWRPGWPSTLAMHEQRQSVRFRDHRTAGLFEGPHEQSAMPEPPRQDRLHAAPEALVSELAALKCEPAPAPVLRR